MTHPKPFRPRSSSSSPSCLLPDHQFAKSLSFLSVSFSFLSASSLLFFLLIFLQQPGPIDGQHAQIVRTAVSVGSTISFECRSSRPAIWIHTTSKRVLSFGTDPFDESVNMDKYSFVADKKRGIYYLIVKDVRIEDSGEYR